MYYKDMEVWKEAINLVLDIYALTETFPSEEKFGLTSQMRRCAVSIPSNIAEGSARFSSKDTSKFVGVSIASLAELDTQLIIAQKLGFVSDMDAINDKVNKVAALLRGLKTYLEKNS